MTEEHREIQTPLVRPRRLRRTPALRRMVAETSVQPSSLVLPVFVRENASATAADLVDAGRRPALA